MSKKLDEVALLAEVAGVISDYGKQVTFLEKDNTPHVIWATPPKASKETFGEDNALETLTEFLVANDATITFTIYRGQRVNIDTPQFRIERVEEIRSGDNIIAYKCFVAR